MGRLEKLFSRKGDRKGTAARRAAEAAGISPNTWRRWRSGTQKPGPAALRKLEGAYNRLITLPKFRRSLADQKVPNVVRVSAKVRWSKSPKSQYNKTKYRTVDLESMRQPMVIVIRAWGSAGPQAAAEAFERETALNYSAAEIAFEGDNVTIEFPDKEH